MRRIVGAHVHNGLEPLPTHVRRCAAVQLLHLENDGVCSVKTTGSAGHGASATPVAASIFPPYLMGTFA